MYYYILDTRNVPQKQFERNQAELQSLLTEFKISGEMARITPLRVMQDLVDTAASRGVKTLVACGTDETFHQMLVATKDREFTLGFIPFVPGTQLGRILGFNDLQTCVKTIASRRIERLDLARINGSYFISYLELGVGQMTNQKIGWFSSFKLFAGNPTEVKMRIDDAYTVSVKMMGGLVVNTRGTKMAMGSPIANPQDGFLDLLMIEKLSRFTATRYKREVENGCYEKIPSATVIRCQKIEFLEPNNLRIYIDGHEVARVPSVVEVIPGKLRMIVGKNRTF